MQSIYINTNRLTSSNIEFDNNYFLVYKSLQSCPAGFGDRIVGLVSAILLAKWSNRKLMIDWQHPYLGVNYVNQFPFDSTQIADMTYENLDCIDHRDKYKELIQTRPNLSESQVVFLECNQEIASFHAEAKTKNFLFESAEVYRNLFTIYFKCLIPSSLLCSRKQIGIQIRAGDTYMKVGYDEFFTKHNLIDNILPKCANLIRTSGWSPDEYDVFLTSDTNCSLELRELLSEYNILYTDGIIEHLGRQNTLSGTEKTLSDLNQLKHSHIFIISWHSNYGRLAALSAPLETPIYVITEQSKLCGPIKNKECLTRKVSYGQKIDVFQE